MEEQQLVVVMDTWLQMAPNKSIFYRISRSGIAVIRKGEVGGLGCRRRADNDAAGYWSQPSCRLRRRPSSESLNSIVPLESNGFSPMVYLVITSDLSCGTYCSRIPLIVECGNTSVWMSKMIGDGHGINTASRDRPTPYGGRVHGSACRGSRAQPVYRCDTRGGWGHGKF